MRRDLIFIICFLVRLAVAIAAYFAKGFLSIPFFVVGLGFIVTAATGKSTGFFGGEAYWMNLRILHALIWIAAGFLILANLSLGASIIIVFDLLIGTSLVCSHYC